MLEFISLRKTLKIQPFFGASCCRLGHGTSALFFAGLRVRLGEEPINSIVVAGVVSAAMVLCRVCRVKKGGTVGLSSPQFFMLNLTNREVAS